MPQHKSAAKRVRQSAKRRIRNRDQRSKMRTMMSKLGEIKDREEAQAYLSETKSYLDRMVRKNIIHKNKAANYKSALEKAVNAL